jgi:sigma-B regulation protein RsbU (phosphoserine phosphatase)
MALLVVDPDEESAQALSEHLSGQGFTVVCARPGSEAVQLAATGPDLVLCAVHGEEHPISTALMLHQQVPDAPLVVVSRNGINKTDVIEALRLGAVDVVQLDEAGEDLAATLNAAIARCAKARSGVDAGRRAEEQLRELQRDQRAGHYIQMGMLPPSPMAIDRYRLRHKIFPSLMLSGDFVDYFRITDRHFAFYIADVSGHGASSAFVTVLLKNFSRRLRREYRPSMLKYPGEILRWLNGELLDNELDKHVALFIGIVDVTTDELAYANAGHFPLTVLCDDSGARFLEIAGRPAGLFADADYRSESVALEGRTSLMMVSDGILEIMDEQGLAKKEARLLEVAAQCHDGQEEAWQALGLEALQPGPDDMSCLTVSKEQ